MRRAQHRALVIDAGRILATPTLPWPPAAPTTTRANANRDSSPECSRHNAVKPGQGPSQPKTHIPSEMVTIGLSVGWRVSDAHSSQSLRVVSVLGWAPGRSRAGTRERA